MSGKWKHVKTSTETKETPMREKSKLRGSRIVLIAILAAAALSAAEEAPVVNINTAGVEELMLLPRIGPAVAERIVDFREKNGRFKSAEDLLLVQGVGEKTFELIKPHVAISGETTLSEKVQIPKAQSGSS
jgi:competence protein ComEA